MLGKMHCVWNKLIKGTGINKLATGSRSLVKMENTGNTAISRRLWQKLKESARYENGKQGTGLKIELLEEINRILED